jgi:hypothetical protein
MAKKWHKQTLQLKDNHTWKAKPGYRIFVADRGVVRFNFPEKWVVKPDKDCIKFHDAEPPDESCVLAFSYLRLPPNIDWRALPLADLLKGSIKGDPRKLRSTGKVNQTPRTDLEVAWLESTFIDPEEKREAISYIALARGFNLQSLLTFDYWPEDRVRLLPVWQEVLRSVQLGGYIKDPTIGEIHH